MKYLYVKTHNKTGLKYLGYTSKENIYEYMGSGKRWIRHIKKHGYDVTTDILLATEDSTEIKETGIFFSILWNVVESEKWANLMVETGTGGDNSKNIDYKRLVETKKKNGKTWVQTEESNKKRSLAHTGKKRSSESVRKTIDGKRKNNTLNHSEETKKKISDSTKGISKPHSEEHKTAIRNRLQSFNRTVICCPHCGKQGQHTNMKRWHFDNCKSRP